jgi:hypothetical protein
MATIISGVITFPEETPAFSSATVYVRLEDTSRADAPAQTALQSVQRSVRYSGGTLPFSIEGKLPETGQTLTIRVHVSMSGSSDFQRGDYINKRAYRIERNALPVVMTVAVEAV